MTSFSLIMRLRPESFTERRRTSQHSFPAVHKEQVNSMSGSAQMVAVIDDDTAVRSGISFLLKSLGYLTTTFESADAFLKSASLPHTSCVISDIKMPGMTGVELQERLISSGYRFPIIFVTAFPEESVKARALSAGAHCFLTKPCDPQSIINCVISALRA